MKRVILVLGGGGMKGLAHVGAWKAVRECGVEIAEIVGTSIGSLVGACIAAGQEWEQLAPAALAPLIVMFGENLEQPLAPAVSKIDPDTGKDIGLIKNMMAGQPAAGFSPSGMVNSP